jgi:hypothetical protein
MKSYNLLILNLFGIATASLAQPSTPSFPVTGNKPKAEAPKEPALAAPLITPMLPVVEYQGPIKQGGVPDLRLGVALYEQYHNFINKMPTHLKVIDISKKSLEQKIKLDELLKLQKVDLLGSIRFNFPDGVRILFIPKEKIVIVESVDRKLTSFIVTKEEHINNEGNGNSLEGA